MDYSNIQYYQKNILRGLPNWEIINNANIIGDSILINSGGYAGNALSNNYFSGLTASLYRRISVIIEVDTNNIDNYQNNVEVVIIGTYLDNDNNKYNLYYSINVNKLKNSTTSNKVTMNRVISMENMQLLNCVVYVINHTSIPVTLTYCSMLRSQDISEGQIGESIGYAVTLRKVINHPNGAELFYDGIDTSDKLFWILDASDKFIGLNINNTNRIDFENSDEIMIM